MCLAAANKLRQVRSEVKARATTIAERATNQGSDVSPRNSAGIDITMSFI